MGLFGSFFGNSGSNTKYTATTTNSSETYSNSVTGQIGGTSLGTGAAYNETGGLQFLGDTGSVTYSPYTDQISATVNTALKIAGASLDNAQSVAKNAMDNAQSVAKNAMDNAQSVTQNAMAHTTDIVATKETVGFTAYVPWIVGGLVIVGVVSLWKK